MGATGGLPGPGGFWELAVAAEPVARPAADPPASGLSLEDSLRQLIRLLQTLMVDR
jgi:hypothetical protein